MSTIVVNWFRRQIALCCSCRECSSKVKLTDQVCQTCGAGDPVRIPLLHVAMVAALSLLCIALVA